MPPFPSLGMSMRRNPKPNTTGNNFMRQQQQPFMYDIDTSQGFYLRQLRDMKGGINFGPNGVSLKNFPDYAKLFGWALALGHARSGDAAMISGYCGQSKDLCEALYAFSKSYAKQNQSDYEVFCKAIKSGRLQVANTKVLKD